MSSQGPPPGGLTDEERTRLRRGFDLLPKMAGHGEEIVFLHSDVLSEWIMQVIANPYYIEDVYTQSDERRTVPA